MVMDPKIWRKSLKPMLNDFYKFVHNENVIASVEGFNKYRNL